MKHSKPLTEKLQRDRKSFADSLTFLSHYAYRLGLFDTARKIEQAIPIAAKEIKKP